MLLDTIQGKETLVLYIGHFDTCDRFEYPKKIHTPPTEEISAIQRGRGEKIVSDNSKCIRTSEGGRGVNFLFPPWGWYGCFLELPPISLLRGCSYVQIPLVGTILLF